eukprot:1327641-Prymnesium_polylepis.1
MRWRCSPRARARLPSRPHLAQFAVGTNGVHREPRRSWRTRQTNSVGCSRQSCLAHDSRWLLESRASRQSSKRPSCAAG